MREKIVLIDGHSILNRAFYGVPDLTNSEGLHTNAVYGFLNIMFKILDEEKPEYLTVTFDVHAPTFRHKMFAEYKGTRKPMAEELRQQVPVIKEVLQAMNIEIIEKEGLEADDLLGTISCMCEEKGLDVSIISGDRDTLQLATEHVKIRIPKKKQGTTEVEDYNASDVEARYGVSRRRSKLYSGKLRRRSVSALLFQKIREMYFLCLPIRRDSDGSPLHGERTVLSRFPVIWIRTWKRCSDRCQRLPGR